ncbi:MAG: hypothetical protein K9L66_06935 [Spirochaetaceae bacterium]|nr:hypothetical protein [Spirochaetaceae bacterium]MCF7947954.1 hypothetical protein [Spirochaetia bacterium]MCF7951261.1 hypothetical protein [Spirochaetaceae bacterium]
MHTKQALLDTLTVPFLQRVSRHLIDMYRSKQDRQIRDLHDYLFPVYPAGREKRGDLKKQFIALIKLFHPDTYNFHRKQILQSNPTGSEAQLEFYRRFVDVESRMKLNRHHSQHIVRDAFSGEEVYAFEEDSNLEDYVEAEIFAEQASPQNIYSIIRSLFLGNNLTAELSPIDLEQIDGELILSNQEIEDLDGIQHCTHLRALDLSGNQLDNIYELRFLEDLEELDLSYNHIHSIDKLTEIHSLKVVYLDENSVEDLSPLLQLPSLEFVSVIGNPLSSMQPISELQENGVVVVYF